MTDTPAVKANTDNRHSSLAVKADTDKNQTTDTPAVNNDRTSASDGFLLCVDHVQKVEDTARVGRDAIIWPCLKVKLVDLPRLIRLWGEKT